MTKENIKKRVLQCIDEVTPASILNIGLDYPIEPFINEAARQVIAIAPLNAIGNAVADFTNAAITPSVDGSGIVNLPDKFIRLVKFKMKGWQRAVTIPMSIADNEYYKQFNKYTRGGISKPAVALDSRKLHYFSIPENTPHIIEQAEAVVEIDPGENFPEALIAPLCWLTAAKVLQIMSEDSASAAAKQQFQDTLTMI